MIIVILLFILLVSLSIAAYTALKYSPGQQEGLIGMSSTKGLRCGMRRGTY